MFAVRDPGIKWQTVELNSFLHSSEPHLTHDTYRAYGSADKDGNKNTRKIISY